MSSANLWVLDFLLEADGLDDTLIKHFHDVNASQFEELPPNTQARLMLRVLRDAPAQPTGIAEAALGALNMLKNLADQLPENFAPGANLEALKPSTQLFTEVKTELVLKGLRDGTQGDHPRVILDTFFVPPEQGGLLDPMELERRNEILEGLMGQEETLQLLEKYPISNLNHALLSFVATARGALGPNMLKLVEKDFLEGRYNPHNQNLQGAKRRRTKATTTTEEDAAGMLANMSQNPILAEGLAEGQQGGQDNKGEQVDQMNEDGTTRQLQQMPMAGMEGALEGTNSPEASGGGKAGGAKRRRNGRWSEDETQFLIANVREHGKGKWKKILELGSEIFLKRSQVDLKDKWRNLERQGIVGPNDLPAQPVPQLQNQGQVPGNALGYNFQDALQNLGHAQMGVDGQMAAPMLNPNGDPMNIFSAYAHLQQHGHQMPPEMFQQQMAQIQQQMQSGLGPQGLHMMQGDGVESMQQQGGLPSVEQQQQEAHQGLQMQHQHHEQQHHHHHEQQQHHQQQQQAQEAVQQEHQHLPVMELQHPQEEVAPEHANLGHGQPEQAPMGEPVAVEMKPEDG